MRTLKLSDYPLPIANAQALLGDVRVGNKKAIEAMILGHVRLAIVTANSFIVSCNCNHLGDELDSAALEAVVVAVNNVANGKMAEHDNIAGYILLFIRAGLFNCLRRSNVVYFPRGQEMKQILTLTENELKESNTVDLKDELDAICENELEKLILKSRTYGYTDSEISEGTGLSRLMVQRIRSKMKTRFEEREHGLG